MIYDNVDLLWGVKRGCIIIIISFKTCSHSHFFHSHYTAWQIIEILIKKSRLNLKKLKSLKLFSHFEFDFGFWRLYIKYLLRQFWMKISTTVSKYKRCWFKVIKHILRTKYAALHVYLPTNIQFIKLPLCCLNLTLSANPVIFTTSLPFRGLSYSVW